MTGEKEFDVVLHALQQHRDRLWKMTQQNMNSEFIGMNIMDDIRLQQIDELDGAIKARASLPQRKPLTEGEIMEIAQVSCTGISPHEDMLLFVRAIEAKLKEKNT